VGLDRLTNALVLVGQHGVYCTSQRNPTLPDMVYMTLHYAGDAVAHFNLSWMSPMKVRRFAIGGMQQMLIWDDLDQDQKIRIYDKGVDRPYETDRFADFHLAYRYGDVTIPHVPFQEPLRVQVDHFVDCIRTGMRPQSDGRVGAKVVRILEQADRSLQNGGTREPDSICVSTRMRPKPGKCLAVGTTPASAKPCA